ncbi:hypothetical protein B6I67_07415 [Klebsiella pneumoniae]|uniref:MT-A70 family methyltransferase n=1 Tax=Klebsiella pneumoniae TaxID=573 RepID=UPI000C7D6D0B|nr:MT-A70 family methyltransferase [Klebsiella pneumoniae]PLE21215.1 hypothetical protein B6I67_07415 [Klebsiella pneumoniae]
MSKKYTLIYADPPWTYRDKAKDGERGAGHKYQTMTVLDICRLPVWELAAEDCLLAMWWVPTQPVEALEKAQTKADVYDMLRDDYGLREKGVGLADFVDWQAKCIAELESRTVTVKLPKPHAHLIWIQAGHAPDDYWDDVAVSHSEKDRCCDGSERYPVYARWEIEEMLAAAGIKVEAE